MRLSVVTTLFASAPHLEEFHRRISAAAHAVTPDFELIYVDDGSPDESARLVEKLMERYPNRHIKLIQLTRNHGQQPALWAGLRAATGELVFKIDCDLEEPPEVLLDCFRAFTSQGFKTRDCVDIYTRRRRRRPLADHVPVSLYYLCLRLITGNRIVPHACQARLLSRPMIERLLGDPRAVFSVDAAIGGRDVRRTGVVIDKTFKGYSTYSLGSRIALAVNILFAFSPVRRKRAGSPAVARMIANFEGVNQSRNTVE